MEIVHCLVIQWKKVFELIYIIVIMFILYILFPHMHMSAFISQTVIRTNNICVFIDVYVLYVIRCMNGYDLLWAPLNIKKMD